MSLFFHRGQKVLLHLWLTEQEVLITTHSLTPNVATAKIMNSQPTGHTSSSQNTDRDICTESCLVFKIVQTSEKPIALEDLHQRLEAKGRLLGNQSGTLIPSHVNYLINYLRYEDFLTGGDHGLVLGKKGMAFLGAPSSFFVPIRELMKSGAKLRLRLRLENLNLELGEKYNLPPFRIMSEITIKQLVKTRPTTLAQLKCLASFGRFKAERFGEPILEQLNKKL